ncbi:MAG: murein L,D-transpeptidase family protein [Cytophagaceae bacterium]
MDYLLILLLIFFPPDEGFFTQQLKYQRVKTAFTEKEKQLSDLYKAQQLELRNSHLFLRAFKQERKLELWAKKPGDKVYKLIKTYPVCAASGALGPKRKQGDYQVPEGFYHIDRFNPSSAFHLSLGINYPNSSDQILGNKSALGGDIFIHGSCASIGCLAMTDESIKEIYIAAVCAKSAGQSKIPVHIFPFRFNDELILQSTANNPELLSFWQNLKTGYENFEKSKTLPKVSTDENGKYKFQ